MAIRNFLRKMLGGESSSTAASTLATSCDNKYDSNKTLSKRRALRRSQQRWPSSKSEDTWCSCGSSSISFSETVEIQEIAPLSSLTNNPEELWYQHEEYSDIQKRNRLLAKYVETCDNGDTLQEQKKICTRGLEWMTEGRSTRKRDARRCVLAAQLLKFDDEDMALAYQAVAMESATVARERASNDAKEIEVYLRR